MNSNNNRVRVYDTGYGLKTAAKIVHDKVEAEESKSQKRALSKAQWENGRRRAIGAQRLKDYDRKAARLAELATDAAQLESVLTAGVPDDRRESVETHLNRVRERMNKIEDDMTALLVEIRELADGIVEETVNA
jgi:hypothetical protein